MSIHHVSWAMEQTTGSPTRKAVLLNLAEFANSVTGKCCPHISTIARRTELSEPTVKRSLNDLEAAGFIARDRERRPDGTLGGYRYRLPLVRVEIAPEPEITVNEPEIRATPEPEIRATPHEPGTSIQPTTPPLKVPPSLVDPQAWAPREVDRKQVSSSEALAAVAVLQEWNQQTSQALTSKDWIGKIILRQREHPELTEDDHAAIIASTLNGDRWWKGPPSPSLIYGNGAQFERSMEQARQATTAGARGALAVALDEQRRMREAG